MSEDNEKLEKTLEDIQTNNASIKDEVKQLTETIVDKTEFAAQTKEIEDLKAKLEAAEKAQAEAKVEFESYVANNKTIEVVKEELHKFEHPETGLYHFLSEVKEMGGTSEMGPYRKSVSLSADMQSWAEVCERKFMQSVGESNTGGLTIPQEEIAGIMKIAEDANPLRSMARSIPISGNSTEFTYLDDYDQDGGITGGVIAYWEKEGATATATDAKWDQGILKLNKLFALNVASGEFMADSPIGAAQMFRDGAASSINFKVDNAMLRGNGAGQPLGLLNADSTVSVTKEVGQPAATILTENLAKMWSLRHEQPGSNFVWLAEQECEPQLDYLSKAVGTGGSLVMRDPLKGRPLISCKHCSALGTVGDIILVDWTQYLLASKGPTLAESMHVYFLSDKNAFRMIFRVDGRPWWKSAVTSVTNVDRSWAVTLATRD